LISIFAFAVRLESIEVSIDEMRAELQQLRAWCEADAQRDEVDYDDFKLNSMRGEP
jgi:hypothetical protein